MGASRRKRLDSDSDALLEFLKQVESYTEDLIYGVPPGEGLYHYTDLAGLQGILSSSDIWLTNSRYSNDGEEMTHGYRVASEVIDAEFEVSEAGGQLDRATYLKSVRELLATPPAEGVYICCFCLSGNLLSQWRGYGGNGCGVSIRFDPHGFASVTRSCQLIVRRHRTEHRPSDERMKPTCQTVRAITWPWRAAHSWSLRLKRAVAAMPVLDEVVLIDA